MTRSRVRPPPIDVSLGRDEEKRRSFHGPRETRGPSTSVRTPKPRDLSMFGEVERRRKNKRRNELEHSWIHTVKIPVEDEKRHESLLVRHREVLVEKHCLVGKAAEDKIREMKQTPTEVCIYIVGNPNSGKSSIINSFVHKEYISNGEIWKDQQIYVTFNTHPFIFDIRTPPSPRSRKRGTLRTPKQMVRKRRERYKGVDVILLCCPIIETEFQKLETDWIPEITSARPEGVPVVLVGTKADLRPGRAGYETPKERESTAEEGMAELTTAVVTKEFAEAFAQKIGAKEYVECAAMIGDSGANGVNTVFQAAVDAVDVYRDCTVCQCSVM